MSARTQIFATIEVPVEDSQHGVGPQESASQEKFLSQVIKNLITVYSLKLLIQLPDFATRCMNVSAVGLTKLIKSSFPHIEWTKSCLLPQSFGVEFPFVSVFSSEFLGVIISESFHFRVFPFVSVFSASFHF